LATIVFYISGHGFGHASREIEIINALLARRADVRIVVRTAAAAWLFERTVNAGAPRFTRHPVETDTGMVQIDSLHLDAAESVARARAFMREFDRRAGDESRFLREAHADLVVADIPPLGIAAASAIGIPAVGVSNFTWDWIYEAYPGAADLAARLAEEYAKSALALRLPMAGGFATFPSVIDVPFVARRATRTGEETRRTLGLPLDERLVLVSFGGYGLEKLNIEALTQLDGFVALVSEGAPRNGVPHAAGGGRRGSVLPFDESRMYAAGVRYEDLVRAVDVVLSKPGYGIISECLANDTALLYTSRGDFIEYGVLVEAMPHFLRAAYISHDDLFAGQWTPHLEALLAQPDPPHRPPVDGADIAASFLLDMI